jgi:seryl-tRNA synthetase
MKNNLEECVRQLSSLNESVDKAAETLSKYRELQNELEEQIHLLKEQQKIERNKTLIGNYYKVQKIEGNLNFSLYLKIIDSRLDEACKDLAVIVADSVELCHKGSTLQWYSYAKGNEFFVINEYIVNEGINPNELIQITKEEFLKEKKV